MATGTAVHAARDEGADPEVEDERVVRTRLDLRLPVAAAAAWAGAWLGTGTGAEVAELVRGITGQARPGPLALAVAVLAVAVLGGLVLVVVLRRVAPVLGGWLRRPRRGEARSRVLPWVVVVAVVVGVFGLLGAVRGAAAEQQLLAGLAEQRRPVDLVATVHSDPRVARSAFSERRVVVLRVHRVSAVGRQLQVREDVTLLADELPAGAVLGAGVVLRAAPLPAQQPTAARGRTTWVLRGTAEVTARPDVWWRAAAAVRSSLREVVAERPVDQRALVPSLVVGDDAQVPEDLAEAFRTTGLTHLLAVSGTNLTLLLGVVLWAGGWCGVRGRLRWLLAAACVVAFVLVARSEPSVVRAATMGSVALLALERNGTDRGLRCLSLAILGVLAWDPWMARSVGLALSALATAGILLLTPSWSRALQRWMPRWVALAVAVPAAAQLACTPVVTAIQGEVSLVAVLANVLAAPAVAPATVLGLLAAVVGLVAPFLGTRLALPAAWAVGWIAAVARWCADLSFPALGWGTGGWSLAGLTLLCVLAVPVAPAVLARWWATLPAVVAVLVLVVWGLPVRGWPPPGWVVAACDVGQGDAVVLNAGNGAAVVVDAGPEPRAVRRCLDRLGVREVPLLVVSHFHADHLDGLPGVLEGRRVGAVEVSPLEEPADAARWVRRTLDEAGVPVATSRLGERTRVGDVVLERLWPDPTQLVGPGEQGAGEEAVNDASVVLLAEVAGLSVLLTGDVEPPAQRRLARRLRGVRVDVLKVPHHGSRHQDRGFLDGLAPRVVLFSAGRGNSYGHPASDLVRRLEEGGAVALRTDVSGDVVVVRRGAGWGTATAGVR